jgi:hypothetical protein
MADNKGLIIKALAKDLNDLKKVQMNIRKVFGESKTDMNVPELRMLTY